MMNSLNHGGMGQNVLYAAGHVVWSDTPICGHLRDHIYTRALEDPSAQWHGGSKMGVNPLPGASYDSVLTPWYQDGKLEGWDRPQVPHTPVSP